MSEAGKAVAMAFGAKRTVSHLAPVPMFDPMLASARDIVQSLNWFRREIAKGETLCANMEQVCDEMREAKIAEDATAHVTAAVHKLRDNLTRASNFCTRLENLTAELQGDNAEEDDDSFVMPKVAWAGTKKDVASE